MTPEMISAIGDFAKNTAPLVAVLIAYWLGKWKTRSETTMAIRREACLEAMAVVDAFYANYPDWRAKDQTYRFHRQEPVAIASARAAMNKLAVSCSLETVRAFAAAIGLSENRCDFGPDKIADLRNAVRAELGLGKLKWPGRIAWIYEMAGAKNTGETEVRPQPALAEGRAAGQPTRAGASTVVQAPGDDEFRAPGSAAVDAS